MMCSQLQHLADELIQSDIYLFAETLEHSYLHWFTRSQIANNQLIL